MTIEIKSNFMIDLELNGSVPKLLTAEEASKRSGVPAEKLTQLANDGFAPHVRLAGSVALFYWKDLRPWIARNLVEEGRAKNITVLVSALPEPEIKDALLPECLKPMYNQIRAHRANVTPPCVYFLCFAREVVYVGQTICLESRLAQHMKEKCGLFDSVFYVPIPIERLLEVESAFIKVLNPKLNNPDRETKPPSKEQIELVKSVGDDSCMRQQVNAPGA